MTDLSHELFAPGLEVCCSVGLLQVVLRTPCCLWEPDRYCAHSVAMKDSDLGIEIERLTGKRVKKMYDLSLKRN